MPEEKPKFIIPPELLAKLGLFDYTVPPELLAKVEASQQELFARFRVALRTCGVTEDLDDDDALLQGLKWVCAQQLRTPIAGNKFEEGLLWDILGHLEAYARGLRPPALTSTAEPGERKKERQKDPQRERLKIRVKALRQAGMTHREICERLTEEPERYPSPWNPKTWVQMYRAQRGKVDSYLSDLR